MSARKAVKSARHLSHTRIPRPPYLAQSRLLGLVHREIIAAHDLYSGDDPFLRLWPCLWFPTGFGLGFSKPCAAMRSRFLLRCSRILTFTHSLQTFRCPSDIFLWA